MKIQGEGDLVNDWMGKRLIFGDNHYLHWLPNPPCEDLTRQADSVTIKRPGEFQESEERNMEPYITALLRHTINIFQPPHRLCILMKLKEIPDVNQLVKIAMIQCDQGNTTIPMLVEGVQKIV